MRFPHIQVVDASAGSGKTWRLAQRFIHLLFTSNLRNILAITFTNKAANEMKERILEWLKRAALGDREMIENIKQSDNLGAVSGLSEKLIQQKSEEKIFEILHDYLNFNVSTIDSFLNSIALSSSMDIGLPPGYEITTNPSPYIKYVVDLMLSGVGKDVHKHTELFDEFLNSFLTLEESRSWQPKNSILEKVEMLRSRENMMGMRFEEFQGNLVDKNLLFNLLEKEKKKVTNKRMLKAIENTISTRNIEKMGNWVEELSPFVRKKIDDFFYAGASKRFNSYIAILSRVRSELEEIKKRKRVVFIDEISIRIGEFLQREGIVPEIYFMLGDVIFHYLIDEFQDTNRVQWSNLKPLIENSLSQGGSLFYVGDRKQALFRFRGGDIELFDRVKEDFPSVERAQPVILKENYRSKRNIVEFNNRIFAPDNLKKLGGLKDLKIAEIYENCRQNVARKENPEGGYVLVKKIPGKTNEETGENLRKELILKLQEITAGHRFEEIAILVEENEDVRTITNWLVESGYPAASDVTMDLRKNSWVIEIINFIKFLNSPDDDLSFAAFITGDIFCWSAGISREKIFSFLQDCRNRKTMLYILFREKFPGIWKDYIEPFFQKTGFLPLYDLVFEIFKVYRIFDRIPENEGFFMRLLEIIKEREDSGENSLQSFLDYLEQEEKEVFQIVLPEHTDAIRISTIHKAKGLSFPVVIACFLAKPRIKNEFIEKDKDRLFLKYITKGGHYPFSNRLRIIYDRESEQCVIDALNSFYVALTRAEDELYIFVAENCGPASILLQEEEVGEVLATIQEKKKEYPEKKISEKPLRVEESLISRELSGQVQLASPHWSTKLCREKIEIETFVNKQRRRIIERGTFIHYVLSGIKKIEGDTERIVEERTMQAALEKRYGGDVKEIIKILSNILKIKEVREWFLCEGDNEKEVCLPEYVEGKSGIRRIDRYAVMGDRILVIEYKTGEDRGTSEMHRQQIAEYIELVKKIYPDKKIEGYLLYMDEQRIVKC